MTYQERVKGIYRPDRCPIWILDSTGKRRVSSEEGVRNNWEVNRKAGFSQILADIIRRVSSDTALTHFTEAQELTTGTVRC